MTHLTQETLHASQETLHTSRVKGQVSPGDQAERAVYYVRLASLIPTGLPILSS